MKTEYEAKFLEVDIEAVRQVLRDNGAVCDKPMTLMRRVTIDTPGMKQKKAFLRVRDEGDKVTMTYKQFNELSVDGAMEYEVVVDDFDETVALLSASGLEYGSFQESKREIWHLDGAEIMIDEWPWLKPYIEVESHSEAHVRAVAARLGFDWNEAAFGGVMAAYRKQYPHLNMQDTVGDVPLVRFEDPLPSLLVA